MDVFATGTAREGENEMEKEYQLRSNLEMKVIEKSIVQSDERRQSVKTDSHRTKRKTKRNVEHREGVSVRDQSRDESDREIDRTIGREEKICENQIPQNEENEDTLDEAEMVRVDGQPKRSKTEEDIMQKAVSVCTGFTNFVKYVSDKRQESWDRSRDAYLRKQQAAKVTLMAREDLYRKEENLKMYRRQLEQVRQQIDVAEMEVKLSRDNFNRRKVEEEAAAREHRYKVKDLHKSDMVRSVVVQQLAESNVLRIDQNRLVICLDGPNIAPPNAHPIVTP